ncbi:MAG: peptidylprolyl isomerase [Candidatus Eremiobacteraeota bacterium]|nr:peptidylprolyl isomerase [Candidatus Eremiobacteraeota bacterium]
MRELAGWPLGRERRPATKAARVKYAVVVAACAFALTGCASGAKQTSADKSPAGTYRVVLDTTKGRVTMEIDRSLAPHGAQRFYELVKARYFDGSRFYRVVPGFVVQWGAAADPAVTKKWDVTIPDDPVKTSNTRGTVAFAASQQPNSRTTHLFINYGDNSRLDALGFAPIGRVTSGMSAVDHIYAGYGERPDQTLIGERGNAYLSKSFPRLDYIKSARIVGP